VRLGHPFPSLLNAFATLSIATLAGAPPLVAVRLALSMLSIQVSIGALNDLVDARRDAAQKPGKPIPAGLATAREARALAVGAGVVGVLLSVPSGALAAGVIGFGLAMGYLYDLRLSRTAWSWLPLALALPVVPVHAWLGVTGSLPTGMLALYPLAVLAGAMLALANGLVDLERDARSDRPTAAVLLGWGRAWATHAGLAMVVAVMAVAFAPGEPAIGSGPLSADQLGTVRRWGIWAGVAALGVGALALSARDTGLRERAWELEAAGVAAVGIGWLAGLAGAATAAG
jgi:4-hydroxybenzoate polyprenyltransferase